MKLLSHTALGILLLLEAQGMAAPSPTRQPAPTDLPAALPIERYQPILERSPFSVASQAATPPPVADAGFAKDLVLTGAVRLSDGEYVTLCTRDQTQRFSLKSGETYNGISVVGVAWSDAVGKTKATLKCGSEFGVVGFDEALLHNPAATAAPPLPTNGQPMLPPGVTLPNPNPPRTPGTVTTPGNTSPPPAVPPRGRRIIMSAPPTP